MHPAKRWIPTAPNRSIIVRSALATINYVLNRVPVVYVSTGYALDYHQLTDEPEYADYDHMAKVGNFVHDIALAAADLKNRSVKSGDSPAFPRCR